MIPKSSTIVKTNWFYMQKRQRELALLQNRYNKSSTIVKTNWFYVQKRQRSGHVFKIDARNHSQSTRQASQPSTASQPARPGQARPGTLAHQVESRIVPGQFLDSPDSETGPGALPLAMQGQPPQASQASQASQISRGEKQEYHCNSSHFGLDAWYSEGNELHKSS